MSRRLNHDKLSLVSLEKNQNWDNTKFETDLAKAENEDDLKGLLKSMQKKRDILEFQMNLVDEKITKITRDKMDLLFDEPKTKHKEVTYMGETYRLTPKHAKIFNKLNRLGQFDLTIRNYEILTIETKHGEWSKKISAQLQKLLVDEATKKLFENMGDESKQWICIKNGMIMAFCSDFITKLSGNLNLRNVTEFYVKCLKKWPESIDKSKITHLEFSGVLDLEHFTAPLFYFLDMSGVFHKINDQEGEKLPNDKGEIPVGTKNGMIVWEDAEKVSKS